jgi:hypothetical protein
MRHAAKYRFFIVWPMQKAVIPGIGGTSEGVCPQKPAARHFCASEGQEGETYHRKLPFVI